MKLTQEECDISHTSVIPMSSNDESCWPVLPPPPPPPPQCSWHPPVLLLQPLSGLSVNLHFYIQTLVPYTEGGEEVFDRAMAAVIDTDGSVPHKHHSNRSRTLWYPSKDTTRAITSVVHQQQCTNKKKNTHKKKNPPKTEVKGNTCFDVSKQYSQGLSETPTTVSAA